MKKNLAIATMAAVLALTSCKNSDFEGFTKADNGVHYKFFNQTESAPKAQAGEGISIRYIIKKQSNDSTIFDSKNGTPDGVMRLGLQKAMCVGCIEDALGMMSKGDSAAFILSSDSFFLKTNGYKELPKFVKAGDHLAFYVKMVDIKSKKEIEENQKQQAADQEVKMKEFMAKEAVDFEKYLADNKITAKPTGSGLIYIETKKGTGAAPKETDIVTVHYTGKLMDGTVFDSSIPKGKPATFGLNQVIPGWTEGLQLMKKGGKATLILPSKIGYGPNGNGAITPYSPLVFEVELIEIMPAPPAPAQPMEPGH